MLPGNGIIHNLQLRGTLNAVDSPQLHHPIHAYFIVCSARAERILLRFKNVNLITDNFTGLIMKHYRHKSIIIGI